jgi:2-oxoisovalerate ferredoxin oxidoreductase beta subunit
MKAEEAKRWVGEEMTKVFPLGVYRDKASYSAGAKRREIPLDEVPRVLGITDGPAVRETKRRTASGYANPEIKIAGFGGQGVLFLGLLIAEAGMEAGLNVSWLPSYGPEMRGGTAHCHVRLSDEPISSPLVSQPTVVIAMNEPSLRKFGNEAVAQGLILYNSNTLPSTFTLCDRQLLLIPATEIADQLGSTRVANMVLLGALLERTGMLTPEEILQALPKIVAKPELIELNRRAIEAGRDAAHKGAQA